MKKNKAPRVAIASKKGRTVSVVALADGSLPVLSALNKWLKERVRLAERCEIAAAKRRDNATALRFEHEADALLPVLHRLRADMEAAKKRQPEENIADQRRSPE